MAPEIAAGIQYSKEVDVWSLGCFAYELATGRPPFHAVQKRCDLYDAIISEQIPPIDANRWSPSF